MDAPEKEVKMTDKQKKFCEEYLIDLNGTRAAIRAGYSEDTAGVIASENLQKPYIRKYIDEQLEIGMQQRKTELKTKVLGELNNIAFDEGEIITDKDGNPIGSRKTDKLKALELLGKYTVLFTDKTEVEVKTDNPVSIVIQGVKAE